MRLQTTNYNDQTRSVAGRKLERDAGSDAPWPIVVCTLTLGRGGEGSREGEIARQRGDVNKY